MAIVMAVAMMGVAACSSSESRDRNVQSVAGTSCKPAGQTKKFAKVTHVCGTTPMGPVWFTTVKTKAKAVNCAKLGGVRLKGKNTQVCGRDGKKKVWMLVAPLPQSMIAGVTSLPTATTIPPSSNSDSATATTEQSVPPTTTATSTPIVEAVVPAREIDPSTVTKAGVIDAPATELRVVSKPTKSANGVEMSPGIVVQLIRQDGSDALTSGVEVSLVSATPGVVVVDGTAVTSKLGAATFTNTRLLGPPGRAEIVATSNGLEADSFFVEHSAGEPMSLELTSRPSTVVAGGSWVGGLSARLVDVAGQPVRRAGVVATLRVVGTGLTPREIETTETDIDGVVRFITSGLAKAGTTSLDIVTGNKSIRAVSFDVEVVPADAAGVVVLTMLPNEANVGVKMTDAVKVAVADKFGNTIKTPGAKIVASVAGADPDASHSVFPAEAETDSAGVAEFSDLTIKGAVGNVSLVFSVRDSSSKPFEKSISLVHGLATAIRLVVQPSGARNGQAFAVDPQVEVVDVSGNRVPTTSGTVSLIVPDDERLLAAVNLTATFDETGVAKFEGVKLRGKTGSYTLTYVFGDLTLSTTLTLAHGPVATLEFRDVPASVVAGSRFTGDVLLLDADRNLVTTSGLFVETSINNAQVALWNTGNTGVLSDSWQAPVAVGTYEVRAVMGLRWERGANPIATTQQVSVVAGDANYLNVSGRPSVNWASGVSPADVAIRLFDRYGNAVARGGIAVTASVVSPASGYQVKNSMETTDVTGLASFPKLAVGGAVGKITVRFATDITGVGAIEFDANLGAGAASGLKVVRPAAGARSEIIATVQPIIQIVDSWGNDVKSSGVTISSEFGPSAGYQVWGSAITNSDGRAVFTNFRAAGAVSTRTVEFKASALASASQSLGLEAGNPADVIVGFNRWAVLNSGASVGAIRITDRQFNTVPASRFALAVRAVPTRVDAVWVHQSGEVVAAADGTFDASPLKIIGTRMTSATLKIELTEASSTYSFDYAFSIGNIGVKFGDPGPSGGRIEGVFGTRVSGVAGISGGGIMLESSPTALPSTYATDSPVLSRSGVATNNFVGAGLANTDAITRLNRTTVYAAAAAVAATIAGKTDWFLGSRDETLGANGRASQLFPGVATPIILTSSLVAPEGVSVITANGSDVMNVKTTGYVVPVRLFG